MTIRTDLTIDWVSSPRIITVAAPSTEIIMQDLHDTLRSLEFAAIDKPPIVSSAGKEPLGGGVTVGLTVTLLNAQLAFEARSGPGYVQCSAQGGNLVSFDNVGGELNPIYPTSFTQVVRTSSSSATLQELGAIQYSSFGGGVTVDSTSPYSGTEYPIGTPQEPVNNLTDAMLIATERGFGTIYSVGSLIIDSGGDYRGMIFIGESQTKTQFTISAASLVTGCEFYQAHVDGFLDGNAKLQDCIIDDLDYIHGIIEECVIAPGTIKLGGNDTAHFLDCWSGVPGTGTPEIDCGGSGQSLAIRNYSGGIKIKNKSGSESVSIDLSSGQIILTTTVTAGTIVARGVGKVIDENGNEIRTGVWNGANILNETVSNQGVSHAVWSDTIAAYIDTSTFGGFLASKVLTVAKFLALK